MANFEKKLMISIVRLFEVGFALLAMISVIATVWFLVEGGQIILLMTWIAVLAISIFFWLFLSKIDKSSTLDVLNVKNVLPLMADAARVILGAIALCVALGSIVALGYYEFPSMGFFRSLGVLMLSPLLLLLAVGKKKALYILIIPAMIVPIAVYFFLFRYDDELSIMLVIASSIITSLIVKKHYAKRDSERGTLDY